MGTSQSTVRPQMDEEPEKRDWNVPFAKAEEAGLIKESFQILENAGRNGDKDAAFLLGQEYGVYAKQGWQDFEKAYHWFEIGSELGDAACTYEQGIALLKGLGVAPSHEKGLAKVIEAAEQKNKMALEFLLSKQWQAEYELSISTGEQEKYAHMLKELE